MRVKLQLFRWLISGFILRMYRALSAGLTLHVETLDIAQQCRLFGSWPCI